jgi:hypothetical protein
MEREMGFEPTASTWKVVIRLKIKNNGDHGDALWPLQTTEISMVASKCQKTE